MGFGNGLSIDNSIYNDYKPYLKKYLKHQKSEGSLYYADIYNYWIDAFINMINND